MGVARTVGVDRGLREAGDVRRLLTDVHRAAARPVPHDRDGVAAQQRGDRRGELGEVARRLLADLAQQVLGLLGVARPDVGDLEHRGAHVDGQAREGRARVEHDDHAGVERRQPREQRVAGGVEGQREARDADQVAGPRVGGGERVDRDPALGPQGRDERALRARLDHDDADAGVEVGHRRGRGGDPVGRQGRADEVAVWSGAVGAGVHALRAEPGGGDQHGDRAPGVVGGGGGHHVLAPRGQVGHLDHDVDQRLAGVDDAAHLADRPSTSSVVARVICGG